MTIPMKQTATSDSDGYPHDFHRTRIPILVAIYLIKEMQILLDKSFGIRVSLN